jgi:hypothetical protein
MSRVWNRLERRSNGCLEWTGSRSKEGYGRVGDGLQVRYVHRVVWEDRNGPIPRGWVVHHKCGNPPCSDPEHLMAVDRKHHAQEHWEESGPTGAAKVHADKDACIRGHRFDISLPNGARGCSTCIRATKRRYEDRKKAARHAEGRVAPHLRTSCKWGHPYDGHNGKQRTCSICLRAAGKRGSDKRTAARRAQRAAEGKAA